MEEEERWRLPAPLFDKSGAMELLESSFLKPGGIWVLNPPERSEIGDLLGLGAGGLDGVEVAAPMGDGVARAAGNSAGGASGSEMEAEEEVLIMRLVGSGGLRVMFLFRWSTCFVSSFSSVISATLLPSSDSSSAIGV